MFSWPGLGLTLIDAATAGDVPLAAGIVIAYGGVFLLIHLLLDVLHAVLDPRMRPHLAGRR